MHWQQYVTLGAGLISGSAFFLVTTCSKDASQKVEALFQLALVAFGQWVLYSGGWYGQ